MCIYVCTAIANGFVHMEVNVYMWMLMEARRRYQVSSTMPLHLFFPHCPEVGVVFCLVFKIYSFLVDEYFACVYICTPYVCSAHEGQKRVLDPSGTGVSVYKPPCGCRELNGGPLKDKPVLLTAKTFLISFQLQPSILFFETRFLPD